MLETDEMRVAINAVPLLSPLTGIGQYTKALLNEFDRRENIGVHKFYATGWSSLIREDPLPEPVTRLKSLVRRCLPNSYGVARAIQQQAFTKGIRHFKPDLYHEPNFLAFKTDLPTVITVHDLSWIHYPEMHPVERVAAMNRYFEPALRRASAIITDSVYVKREVEQMFGVPEASVHAIGLGVQSIFRPLCEAQTRPVLSKYQLGFRQYWLAVGTLEPRKNLKLVLEAFLRLPQAERRACPLVLVGMLGWKTAVLQQKIEPLIRSGEVRQLGYLSREDLAQVIAGARALIYPSIYEGFGLPPLEAMAAGVPVIVSNVSSLPEVVGNCGILVEPDDVDGLKLAMQHLSSDQAYADDLGQSGLQRSQQFTWAQCADATLSVYRSVL